MLDTSLRALPPLPTSFLSTIDPREFTVDLSHWIGSTSIFAIQLLTGAIIQGLGLVDKAKKRAMSAMVPRNSQLGRPFSPLTFGGLTAVISIGGILFGQNGMVKQDTIPTQVLSAVEIKQAQAPSQSLVTDMVIDSSKLHTTIPADRGRDSVIQHTVSNGETLEQIAQQYKVTLDSLKYVNNLSDDTIKPGQVLTILPVSGVLETVKDGDTLQSIADKWHVSPQAIVDVNWLDEPFQVHAGQKLVIPNAVIPTPTPTPTPGLALHSTASTNVDAPAAGGSGLFMWPTQGEITQGFSYYHNGIDIGDRGAAPPILAADSGTVTFAGWWNGGGGNSVWVDHHNGYVTQYAHMSKIIVSVGQNVGRGQQVGVMGDTGLSFGTHLMFNVEKNGHYINPLAVLP